MRKTAKPLINLIYYPVLTLGPMERLGIWFQGCSIRCKGCISDHGWEFDPRYRMTWKEGEGYLKNRYGRLTISGGEPFDQPEVLLKLLKTAKKYSYYDILIYSGYTYASLSKRFSDILSYIDVLIDGPFMKGRYTNKAWKGSSNQCMYILNPKLKDVYEEYSRTPKNKNLQFVADINRIFIVGIPYQQDTEEIKNALVQDLSRM